ncbi:hypothetical protein Rhe02_10080 [Rhizocola hellebori]|uniref:CAAX prenyl protease 2/Lysostaphin resistance protein A-like domain-containing protein n=1 Tax=Rhizocola hellebori TaxID=1392758 RepID=A0A8J3Q3F1_9ACTN|nr:CPBP family intramembrane glutamic endopeptidase [Rhizocola hellebori]GIH02941.1 hypothetical protein Rhe02_10080 [Rhizocola hellebori]
MIGIPRALLFAVAAIGLTAAWLAAYRLPFADPRTRQRVRLAISSLTGLPARYVFSILGTVIYLVLGGAAAYALLRVGRLNPVDLLAWRISGEGAALTLLAGIGASALTAFAMSVLHALPGRADVPTTVADVRWIQEIVVLPRPWRSLIPGISGALEEFYFRGVMLFGLLATGFPVWAALVFTGAVFTAGQVALTESRMQATVLAISSIVLSVVCGLLTVVEGSVLPAILIHASFAGYYTNMSVRRTAVAANPPR